MKKALLINPETARIEKIELHSSDAELINEIKELLDCESVRMLAIFPNICDVIFFDGDGSLKLNKAFQLLDLPKVFGKAIVCGYDATRQTSANNHSKIKELNPLITFFGKDHSDYIRNQGLNGDTRTSPGDLN